MDEKQKTTALQAVLDAMKEMAKLEGQTLQSVYQILSDLEKAEKPVSK